MGRVLDVADETDVAVLRRTESDGLLGSDYLADEPLARYLADAETAQYVAWNTKRGVRVISDGTELIEPAGSYRAFAVATDVRVLFVVGDDDGDRAVSIPYTDVLTVDTTARFLSSTLELVAAGEERWQFPCRGDLEPLAQFVDEASQTWAHADRLLSDAADRLADARRALDDGAFGDCEAVADEATGTVTEGRDRLDALGAGAAATAADRVGRLETGADRLRRRARVGRGDEAHERARAAWEDREYERAYDDYERANEAYDRALAVDAERPTDREIQRRLDVLADEQARLSDAPVTAARAAEDAARAAEDADVAAARWEVALERYQSAIELDWGGQRRFAGDPESLRAAAADAAAELVDARTAAGRECLAESDRLAEWGDTDRAGDALADARAHFERARAVATELVPDRRDPPTDELATVTERVATAEHANTD